MLKEYGAAMELKEKLTAALDGPDAAEVALEALFSVERELRDCTTLSTLAWATSLHDGSLLEDGAPARRALHEALTEVSSSIEWAQEVVNLIGLFAMKVWGKSSKEVAAVAEALQSGGEDTGAEFHA